MACVATEIHKSLRFIDGSKESRDHVASRWILTCFSRLLYIFTVGITLSGSWEGGLEVMTYRQ
jgi:hypothetical protein